MVEMSRGGQNKKGVNAQFETQERGGPAFGLESGERRKGCVGGTLKKVPEGQTKKETGLGQRTLHHLFEFTKKVKGGDLE